MKFLAVLADCDIEGIKSSIDFWMTDHAGDCATLLENLGVSEEKVLKYTAQIILGADHAAEQKFSVAKKISIFLAFCQATSGRLTAGLRISLFFRPEDRLSTG